MTRTPLAVGIAACATMLLSSCDEATAPTGDPSTVEITVYVDADGSGDLTAGDLPLASVTVDLTGPAAALSAETGSDGVARFGNVPPGSYRASQSGSIPAGTALATATNPVVVAQFGGGTVRSEFRYAYLPGDVAGHVYRDDDESRDFDPELDTPAVGLTVSLFAGGTATGEPLLTATTDAMGAYGFVGLRPGPYTVVATPFETIEFPDGDTRSATVPPGGAATADFIFTGSVVIDVAEARQRAEGSVVTVEAVVTVGTGPFGSSAYFIQDATTGIAVFDGSRPDLEIGDLVRLTGTRSSFQNEIQVSGSITLEVLGTEDPPDPRPINGAELAAGLYQGELAILNGVTVTGVDVFTFDNHNVLGTDAAGDAVLLFVDSRTGIGSADWTVGETYTVTGVLSTRFQERRLRPRMPSDVLPTSTVAEARALADGERAANEGVVTVPPGPFGSSVFYYQDDTGGMAVFMPQAPAMSIGDRIRVAGTRSSFQNETQLGSPVVSIRGSGPEPAPRLITAAELNAGEAGGELIRIENLTVQSVAVFSFDNHAVTATVGGEQIEIFVDSRSGIGSAFWSVGTTYDVVGVQNPRFDVFRIKPRRPSDVTAK